MAVLQVTPTRDLVLRFFTSEKRFSADVQSLATILDGFLGAPDLQSQLNALVDLKEWTVKGSPSTLKGMGARLEAFITLIETQSELRIRFQQVVREILPQIHSVESFAEAGLHPRGSFWSEAARRLTQRILPSALDDPEYSREAWPQALSHLQGIGKTAPARRRDIRANGANTLSGGRRNSLGQTD